MKHARPFALAAPFLLLPSAPQLIVPARPPLTIEKEMPSTLFGAGIMPGIGALGGLRPAAASGTVVTWTTAAGANRDVDITISGGDLTATSAGQGSVRATTSQTTLKRYFEGIVVNNNGGSFGVCTGAESIAQDPADMTNAGTLSLSSGIVVIGASGVFNAADPTNGDVLGVAFDIPNLKIYFSINGSYIDTNNPGAGTGGYTMNAGTYFPVFGTPGAVINAAVTANFGATAFNTAPPSGYVAWNA